MISYFLQLHSKHGRNEDAVINSIIKEECSS